MTPEERESFVEDISKAISQTISEDRHKCDYCQTEERRIAHRKDHEFITSLIELFNKFDTMRWSLLSAVLKALLIAGVLGGIAFAWKNGVK